MTAPATNSGTESVTAAQRGKKPAWRADMDAAPTWDVRGDLARLRGIAAALAYLTSPVHSREDSDMEIFHEVLAEFAERLDTAEEKLSAVISGMRMGGAETQA
jgi:hypothetical protein